jgi:hypothetical protein
MNLKLTHTSFNEITLEGGGLELKIKPSSIFKNCISAETQSVLDEMIETSLKKALDDFYTSEEYEQKDELQTKQIVMKHVKNIALIERLAYELHSDSECINLSKTQSEIRDFCYTVWRYSREYGFKPSQSKVLEDEN